MPTEPARHRRSPIQRAWALLRRLGTLRRATVILYRHSAFVHLSSPAEVVPVTVENVEDARSMESQARIEEFRSFLARGDLGFYGYVEGRVVHRAWVRPGPVRVPTWHSFAPLDIGENEAWIHYCETAPEARGKGIYPAVLGEVVARLRKAGTTRCTIGTEASNLASRRGIEKAGFEPWCTLRIVVLFGGLVTRVTKATKGAQE